MSTNADDELQLWMAALREAYEGSGITVEEAPDEEEDSTTDNFSDPLPPGIIMTKYSNGKPRGRRTNRREG